jgi:DNA polymerase III subunit chi
VKVDFYILEQADGPRSRLFACQLLEKMVEEQKRVFVHMRSREEAARFDTLLWTYRDDSFIPHQIDDAKDTHPPLIQIGFGEAPTRQHDIMLNLCTELAPFYPQFQHIIEIVFSDALVQQLARERYRRYRDSGYELTTHKL